MQQLLLYLKKYPIYIIIGVVLVLGIIIISLVSQSPSANVSQKNSLSPVPTITPFAAQDRFNVIKTDPSNGEVNIFTGEIVISFTTDVPIMAEKNFSLTIAPALPHYWRFINAYPTKIVRVQVYGGLVPSTQYLLSVKNALGQVIYSWSFTTTAKSPPSSSGLAIQEERDIIKKYYPLFYDVPYATNDFWIDTHGRLGLQVKIKNGNAEQVKKEVLDWIKSKGVDPSTHTIEYTQQ